VSPFESPSGLSPSLRVGVNSGPAKLGQSLPRAGSRGRSVSGGLHEVRAPSQTLGAGSAEARPLHAPAEEAPLRVALRPFGFAHTVPVSCREGGLRPQILAPHLKDRGGLRSGRGKVNSGKRPG
jgi:hypothetical protein